MKNIRIAIAEDHEIVRQGIVELLNKEKNMSVVTDVCNGSRLLYELRTHLVDIVITDSDMPVMGGKELLEVINRRYPTVKVIILSAHSSDAYVLSCIRSGARAFLSKACNLEKLVDAINAVYRQGYFFDDKTSKALLYQMINKGDDTQDCHHASLTKREVEIVSLICLGLTNKAIAEQLFVSIRTVEVHRKNICKKTQATNTVGVVIYAIKNGIFQI